MPSLRDIGDSEAVDNKYVDRIVFYVEGPEDQSLFKTYLLSQYLHVAEVKTPKDLGSGYAAVIHRVQQERIGNEKIFGLVDGDALVMLGLVEKYWEYFGEGKWIHTSQFDGIFFFPCWELENMLCDKEILPGTLIAAQPVWRLTWRSERIVKNIVLREALFLSEISAMNIALAAGGGSIIRAETKTGTSLRVTLRQELLEILRGQTGAREVWQIYCQYRRIFIRLIRSSRSRDELYEKLVSRVDGKALLIRVKREMKVGQDIRSLLAYNYSKNGKAIKFFRELLDTAKKHAGVV